MVEQSPRSDKRAAAAVPAGLSATLTILVSAVAIGILYLAAEVIIPIALAVLLSFLLAPAVRWLRRFRVGRVPAVGLTVLLAFLTIFGFSVIVAREGSSLAQELPRYRHNIEEKIRFLPDIVPGSGAIHRTAAMLDEFRKELARSESRNSSTASPVSPSSTPAVEPAKPIPVEIQQPEPGALQVVESVVGPLLRPMAMAGLVLVFVVMMLFEWEDLRDRLLRLAGRGDLHRTTEAMNDTAYLISRYLLRQLVVNAGCGLLLGLGLAVIGIPQAALWGILAALLRFIPYLGIVIAACFPAALAIAIDPGWTMLVWTVALYAGIELVVANLLEPRVYAAGVGLSSVALIAAATFWTWLWGPIGLLLSTPLTVCLAVVGRHVPQLQFLDVMLGNEPVLAPDETLYQRLLANDPEEATEQAETFMDEQPLAAFFDAVAIPALARAQADSERGVLSPERCAVIKEGIRAMLENLCDDVSAIPEHVQSEVENTPSILCLAGRTELDEAAALLLAHLVRAERHVGIGQPTTVDTLVSDDAYTPLFQGPVLVILSLISTDSLARARYLVRRVRRRAPQATILLGLWGLTGDEKATTAATAADIVVFSFADAIRKIEPVPSNLPLPSTTLPQGDLS
jgi:predicted PurR-regulated permease PerM